MLLSNFKKNVFVIFIIIFSLMTLHALHVYASLNKDGFIVLIYHEILDKGIQSQNKYQHAYDDFIAQIDYLKQQRYRTILPSQLGDVSVSKDNEKIIMLTFDDGTPGHYSNAYPYLRHHGYNAIFFIISNYVDRKYSLSKEQIQEMSQNGMEIGSHTANHYLLTSLERDQILNELTNSKETLTAVLGKEVTSFAPPGGWYNNKIIEMSKELGYRSFFSCDIGVNDNDPKLFIFNRVEVLGDMSYEDFQKLLDPSSLYFYRYKLVQSYKFLLVSVVGIENYRKIGEFKNKFKYATL
jgi:peptidoglycan/xylan/chitin deacetylase (PgdA/CDA1 family)